MGQLIKNKMATHLEADSTLHQLFLDVCALTINAIIDATDNVKFVSNESRQYTLLEYFFVSPFGFIIIRNSYLGVH